MAVQEESAVHSAAVPQVQGSRQLGTGHRGVPRDRRIFPSHHGPRGDRELSSASGTLVGSTTLGARVAAVVLVLLDLFLVLGVIILFVLLASCSGSEG